jgi:hypothetical protein
MTSKNDKLTSNDLLALSSTVDLIVRRLNARSAHKALLAFLNTQGDGRALLHQYDAMLKNAGEEGYRVRVALLFHHSALLKHILADLVKVEGLSLLATSMARMADEALRS